MTVSVWRLRGRHNIESVRRARRCSSGPVWVRFLPNSDSGTPPEIGYAVGRAVGGAVVRNRLRRRLRAVMFAAPELRPGRYLLGAGPEAADLSFSALAAATHACLRAAGALPGT
ncbi:MAG TPA: ribonuclease P protein component [Acidimicrobiales bacterium]|nr:ribonuclease P protein component [Acidimicrobiales bacterium]